MRRKPLYALQTTALLTLLGFSMAAWSVEITPDLQLHGYATLGLAKLGNNQQTVYPYDSGGSGLSLMENEASTRYDSVAGLQLNYRLNAQISMALQAYLAAQDLSQKPTLPQYAVKLQSAYIDYTLNEHWKIRTGRFPFAAYLYSDNNRVGEAYPWARLPPEVYSKLGGLFAENGVAAIYTHTFGNWDLRIQPSIGQENLNSYQVNRLVQLNASLATENLTLHLGSAQAAVKLGAPLVHGLRSSIGDTLASFGYSPTDIADYNASFDRLVPTRNLRGVFSDAGLIYDDGRWFAAGELGTLRISGFVNDFNSGYASFGYHIGKWLPYVIYAKYKSVNLDESAQIPSPGDIIYRIPTTVEQHSLSLGARYKIRSNISLKLQADRVSGFAENYNSGLFSPSDVSTPPPTLKAVYIYSISLNTAF